MKVRALAFVGIPVTSSGYADPADGAGCEAFNVQAVFEGSKFVPYPRLPMHG